MHSGNVDLILNPSSGHISPRFYFVFDDDFYLVSSLRSNTEPPNWDDLVSRSDESASNGDIESSKILFNQHYDDTNQPESVFDATFTVSNSNQKPDSSIPLQDNTNSSTNLLANEVENGKSSISVTLE